MATWRPLGKISPVVGEWLMWQLEATGTVFRLNCAPLPANTASYLWIREWRNGILGEKKLIYPKLQQTFILGKADTRSIEVCKLYPHWATGTEEPYDLGLEEKVEEPETVIVEQPRPRVGYH